MHTHSSKCSGFDTTLVLKINCGSGVDNVSQQRTQQQNDTVPQGQIFNFKVLNSKMPFSTPPKQCELPITYIREKSPNEIIDKFTDLRPERNCKI